MKAKHKIRRYFNVRDQKKAVCPHCDWTTVVNVTRMFKHLSSSCTKVPPSVRDEILKLCPKKKKQFVQTQLPQHQIRRDASISSDSEESEAEDEAVARPAKRTSATVPIYSVRSKETSIKTFCDKVNKNEQDRLEALMAKAMYATATPFSRFDHPYWHDFLNAMRPAFKVPSSKVFSSRLLNSQYDDVKSLVEEKIALSETLALGTDGWTNSNRGSIVNIMMFTPEPIFLRSIESKTERHTGQMYFDKLDGILKERGPEKFSGVCTDNASNMKLGGLMIEEKYPYISWYGCSMHGLHLNMKDICTKVPTMSGILSECHSITREILRSPILFAIFCEKQEIILKDKSVTLKLPCETRFGSNFRCMESVMTNQGVLKALCIDSRITVKVGNKYDSLIDENIKRSILSDELWLKIPEAIEILKPFYHWLFYVQGNTTFISEIPVCMKDIEVRVANALRQSIYFSDADSNIIDQLIAERKEFILRDVHLAAALLDPAINHDEYLTCQEKDKALSFINNLAEILPHVDANKVASDCVGFLAKSGNFAGRHLWRKMDQPAYLWWKAFCSQTELAKVAQRILPLIASSAAVERTFNSQGHIHSKRRNRMAHPKVEKLLYVYENYRAIDGRLKIAKKQKVELNSERVEGAENNISVSNRDTEEPDVQSVSADLENDCDKVLSSGEDDSSGEEGVWYEQPYVSDDDD